MSLKSKFKSSSALVKEGVWCPVTTNSDGSECRVRLRRSGRTNRDWTNSFRERTAGVDMENISAEDDERITVEVFVDAVLVDWENLQPDDDGANLPFSKENAVKLLTDPDWTDLLVDWQGKASALATFQPKLEGDAKN